MINYIYMFIFNSLILRGIEFSNELSNEMVMGYRNHNQEKERGYGLYK